MAGWDEAHWQSDISSGIPRAEQRSETYTRYVPDRLDGASLAVDGPLSRDVGAIERGIRALNGSGAEGLAGIARFLLRSEAIASSRIEGIAPSAQQVALAELAQTETVQGISEQAKLVANNMTVVRHATSALAQAETLTVDHVVELHRSLLPEEPRHHGLRTVQNWIGTSSRSPIGAAYVPPAPEQVPELMADLVDYINGAAHAPLVQAAVIHAQFETIHPFVDGNGRVGRAIIHRYLRHSGLASHVTVPISAGLLANTRAYVDALTAYRAGDPVPIVYEMARAAKDSAAVGEELVNELQQLRLAWDERVSARRDSAVWAIADALIGHPAVTAEVAASIAGVTAAAARSAIATLVEAGVLRRASVGRRNQVWVAEEVTGCYDRIAVLIGRRKAY